MEVTGPFRPRVPFRTAPPRATINPKACKRKMRPRKTSELSKNSKNSKYALKYEVPSPYGILRISLLKFCQYSKRQYSNTTLSSVVQGST